MIIEVRVRTNAKQESVVRITDGSYLVSVNQPPREGRANIAVLKALSKHLGVSISRLSIKHGARSNRKLVEAQLPEK